MKRDLYQKLLDWKSKSYRKPLILNGARQVGKTYLLKMFCQEFPQQLYLNFEEKPQLASFFQPDLDPERILKHLQLYGECDLGQEDGLIIFDEIQACPQAITSLKYFQEQYPRLPIIAAGSLLGVKLKRDKISFPVGKVEFLDLFPLSFFEFLEAIGKAKLRQQLETHPEEPLPTALHEALLEDIKLYFVIGGMPEPLQAFIKTGDMREVRPLQQAILSSYAFDFAKYAESHEVMKIMNVWQSIPGQLAKENKKFIFTAIQKSARGREFMSALQWLKDAGLIYFCQNVSTPRLPLMSYAEPNCFKVYLLDVGLLGCMSQLPENTLLKGSQLLTEFKGALTENFAASELVATQGRECLYYWTSTGQAEVDFIIHHGEEILPLEVKSGEGRHMKSLQVYQQRYQTSLLTRISPQPFIHKASFLNCPLYLIQMLTRLSW